MTRLLRKAASWLVRVGVEVVGCNCQMTGCWLLPLDVGCLLLVGAIAAYVGLKD